MEEEEATVLSEAYNSITSIKMSGLIGDEGGGSAIIVSIGHVAEKRENGNQETTVCCLVGSYWSPFLRA
jgi:hypothetical protein